MASDEIKITIDQALIDIYNSYYFKKYPARRKPPIDRPIHPSLNIWSTMTSLSRNGLKQKWREFVLWFIEELQIKNRNINTFDIEVTTYMPTRRRSDPDNFVPKFILDGLVEGGVIQDDDGKHLKHLILSTDYDKENPRTEIKIKEIT